MWALKPHALPAKLTHKSRNRSKGVNGVHLAAVRHGTSTEGVPISARPMSAEEI